MIIYTLFSDCENILLASNSTVLTFNCLNKKGKDIFSQTNNHPNAEYEANDFLGAQGLFLNMCVHSLSRTAPTSLPLNFLKKHTDSVSSTSSVFWAIILCLHPHRHNHNLHPYDIPKIWLLLWAPSGELSIDRTQSDHLAVHAAAVQSWWIPCGTVFCCRHTLSTVGIMGVMFIRRLCLQYHSSSFTLLPYYHSLESRLKTNPS